MTKYYFELDPVGQTFDSVNDDDLLPENDDTAGTIVARDDTEAVNLCKAIAVEKKLPLMCVYQSNSHETRMVYELSN